MSDARSRRDGWDAERVRHLRGRLGLTQRQLADELGVRQQTVSEWETGIYQPRGASARLLRLIAEREGASYDTGNRQSAGGRRDDPGAASDSQG